MGGGHHHNPEAMPKADQDLDLLRKEQIPIYARDNCAHLLVNLNRCRMETYYNPHRCTQQRHLYDECQYIAWERRKEGKKIMQAQQAKAAAEAAAEAAAAV